MIEVPYSCPAFSIKLYCELYSPQVSIITQFLAIKLWARIPLQIGDSLSALFLYLSVNFHKCVIWPAFCAASSTVTVAFKLADIKLESSETHLLKLEKNLSQSFLVNDFLCKNAVLNICRSLERFYTYRKINNIFLKLHHSLLKMPKIIELG